MTEYEHQIGALQWRLKEQRYRLIGQSCLHCGEKIFPPKDVCPNCEEFPGAKFIFSGTGEVYSYTTVSESSANTEERPITVAIIKLDEGPFITAQITDLANPFNPAETENPADRLEIGKRVEIVTRVLKKNGEKGIIDYGYKFRLVGNLG